MTELPVGDLSTLCRGEPPPVLLDVREPWETALAPLVVDGQAALAIPMRQLPARLDELDPQRAVVCVCHHGVRSAHVATWLEGAGFERVYNLAGGIDAWSRDVDPAVPRY